MGREPLPLTNPPQAPFDRDRESLKRSSPSLACGRAAAAAPQWEGPASLPPSPGAAGPLGSRRSMAAEYVFLDRWLVDAQQEAVFDALADARTYPVWWTPTYKEVTADGPPAVGRRSHQRFKARLPYTLSTVSTIVRLERPREFEIAVEGDLRGHGIWTLTPMGGRVEVRFDWRVHADRALLRVLTPFLRPLFRWNHDQAIRQAMEGLEPYARGLTG